MGQVVLHVKYKINPIGQPETHARRLLSGFLRRSLPKCDAAAILRPRPHNDFVGPVARLTSAIFDRHRRQDRRQDTLFTSIRYLYKGRFGSANRAGTESFIPSILE
jgi:hypothetical protein